MTPVKHYVIQHPTNYIQLYITPTAAGLPERIEPSTPPRITSVNNEFSGWLVVGWEAWEDSDPVLAQHRINCRCAVVESKAVKNLKAAVKAKQATPLCAVFYIQYKNVADEFGPRDVVSRADAVRRIGIKKVLALESGEVEQIKTDFAQYTWTKDKKR